MRLVFREGFGLELGLVYVVEGFALGGWEVFAEGVCVLHVLGEVAVVLDESWGERGYEGIDDGGLILCITHDVAFVQVTHDPGDSALPENPGLAFEASFAGYGLGLGEGGFPVGLEVLIGGG